MNNLKDSTDVVLIGGGIMSATLGVMLKELDPSININIFEALDAPALESSSAWNNAGTGHAANMEFNYTPIKGDGTIDISKALQVNMEFDLSRQFWAYLVKKRAMDPDSFIHSVPHVGFVHGSSNIPFLEKRFAALSAHHAFYGMEFTLDQNKIYEWAPLIIEGRDKNEPVAATRMITGTDVDYGSLTNNLIKYLNTFTGFSIHYSHEVNDITRSSDGQWVIHVLNKANNENFCIKAKFVYIAAGGRSLLLLQKANIPEGKGYGGFPVSGIWLRCDNEEITKHHNVKVYGQEPVGSPPMSAPHLDTRIIEGQKSLLFGPFAGFSTKFLKHGSIFDLFYSIKFNNIFQLLTVAKDNLLLVRYLLGQIFETNTMRMNTLHQFYPNASLNDWKLQIAGQRVQIIKPSSKRKGVLEFGTELVSSQDHTLTALLGASPGASTAVYIALCVVEKCFKGKITPDSSLHKLKEMIPSYGESLLQDAELCKSIRAETATILKLK